MSVLIFKQKLPCAIINETEWNRLFQICLFDVAHMQKRMNEWMNECYTNKNPRMNEWMKILSYLVAVDHCLANINVWMYSMCMSVNLISPWWLSHQSWIESNAKLTTNTFGR